MMHEDYAEQDPLHDRSVSERMDILRQAQERMIRLAREMEQHVDKEHPLNFRCQCAVCVRCYTITHADAKWLKDQHILWTSPEKPPVDENK